MENCRCTRNLPRNPLRGVFCDMIKLARVTGNKSCRNLDTIMRRRCTSPKHFLHRTRTRVMFCGIMESETLFSSAKAKGELRLSFCYNRVMDEHDKSLTKWYKSVATVLGIIMGVMVVAIIIKVCLG